MENRNHIIKIIYPRKNMLGMDDDIKIINILNSFTPIDVIKPSVVYGYLYDNTVVNDNRNITSEGWKVPNNADWSILINYLINKHHYIYLFNLSRYLKSKNFVNSEYGWEYDLDIHPRWDENSEHIGTDMFGFNLLPGGIMTEGFNFMEIGSSSHYWSSSKTTPKPYKNHGFKCIGNSSRFYGPIIYDNTALNIKLIKNELSDEENKLKDGDILEDIYLGNDNKTYDGVKIGDQIWLVENLAETKYRNGDSIDYFFDENQPFLYGNHTETGGITIENDNILKINRNNVNNDGVIAWLNNIKIGDYCRVHKKNSFSNFWFGKRIASFESQLSSEYLTYNFEFITKLGVFNVDDEVILSYYKKTDGFRYSYDNKKYFTLYPNNNINQFDDISPLKLNNLNEMEYAIRVKEFIKKYVSLPNIRTELINSRIY